MGRTVRSGYLWALFMENMPMNSLLRFLLPAVFLFGCSTDLEINAPYKNITIVYGLMSTKDASDVHFVKINKAFLGDGDAFVFAQVRDSNEYRNDELLARVEQVEQRPGREHLDPERHGDHGP